MKTKLSVGQRLFLAAYNPMFATLFGWHQDAINEEYVRTYGVSGLLKFGKMIGDVLAVLGKRYGEAEANHIVGFAGLLNGCGFCGVGHNLTANVLMFQSDGSIFPIDEQDIPRLQLLEDTELMSEVESQLAGTPYEKELELLQRMYALRCGTAEGTTDEDTYLLLALDMWLVNNECTITIGLDIKPEEVPIFAKFSRDSDLYARYREARGQGK
ncbi:MAG: hypothetical protein ACRBN8_19285 [Nannocystales bacterium]